MDLSYIDTMRYHSGYIIEVYFTVQLYSDNLSSSPSTYDSASTLMDMVALPDSNLEEKYDPLQDNALSAKPQAAPDLSLHWEQSTS